MQRQYIVLPMRWTHTAEAVAAEKNRENAKNSCGGCCGNCDLKYYHRKYAGIIYFISTLGLFIGGIGLLQRTIEPLINTAISNQDRGSCTTLNITYGDTLVCYNCENTGACPVNIPCLQVRVEIKVESTTYQAWLLDDEITRHWCLVSSWKPCQNELEKEQKAEKDYKVGETYDCTWKSSYATPGIKEYTWDFLTIGIFAALTFVSIVGITVGCCMCGTGYLCHRWPPQDIADEAQRREAPPPQGLANYGPGLSTGAPTGPTAPPPYSSVL